MSKSIACIIGLCLVALAATPALGEAILANPDLPPSDGDPLLGYLGQANVAFPGGIDMGALFHAQFININRDDVGDDELADFDSTLTAMVGMVSLSRSISLASPAAM